jgi:hypothetical protein
MPVSVEIRAMPALGLCATTGDTAAATQPAHADVNRFRAHVPRLGDPVEMRDG